MLPAVAYERIDDDGLHLSVDGTTRVLDVDTIVICAGQEPRRELVDPLRAAGAPFTLIGGADVAIELDAKRAIAQGTRVALSI
jgi:2,4-dienoyl-CoA reductase (NADPH2)